MTIACARSDSSRKSAQLNCTSAAASAGSSASCGDRRSATSSRRVEDAGSLELLDARARRRQLLGEAVAVLEPRSSGWSPAKTAGQPGSGSRRASRGLLGRSPACAAGRREQQAGHDGGWNTSHEALLASRDRDAPDPAMSRPGMDFTPSPRAADLTARVADLHGRGGRAGRGAVPPRPRRGAASPATRGAAAGHRRTQGEGPRAGAVEPLPAEGARRRVRRAVRHRRRRGADQRRLRPDRGADRAVGHRPAGLQLQRPGHRQHGGAAALRHRRAERAVAGAAARRPDPLGVHA